MFSFFNTQKTKNKKLEDLAKKILGGKFDLADGTFSALKKSGISTELNSAKPWILQYFGFAGGPGVKPQDTPYDYILKLWCLKYSLDSQLIVFHGVDPIGHPVLNSIQKGEGIPSPCNLFDIETDIQIENLFQKSFGFPIKIPNNFIVWRESYEAKDVNAGNIYAKKQIEVKVVRTIENQDDFFKFLDDKIGW